MDDPGAGRGPARVLLVEQDARQAALIVALLRSAWAEGLVLAQAERLKDANRELLDHGASCVILGLSPHGIDALEHIRTAAPDVPTIVIADRQIDEAEALRAIRLGAQDVLFRDELHPGGLRRAIAYAIERNRSDVQLAHRALHDPLTGLPNRALFLDRLGVALDRSRRTSATIAVLFLDVDNFKQINDSLGHAVGDRLLEELAGRLRSMLRPMDTVARFGGDEFTFLFEELASEREAVLIAERINQVATEPVTVEQGTAEVSVSIGIAMVTDPTVAAETVIREADAAMYRAKELGRSRYELFDESSRQRAMDRLALESALRQAIERSELRVHYQPKVSLANGTTLTGFEALVRWEHPDRGLLAPRDFIPLAEDTGLVLQIGQFVLEQGLRQLARWHESEAGLMLSLNLSARQLEDPGLVGMLSTAIHSSGIDPRSVCLEIAETVVSPDADSALRVLQGLKAVGIKLALDDYGTGYSSLESLRRLPIDALKIHESFVGPLGHDPEQCPVVHAIVELAHAHRLTTVAEGVERDNQLVKLRELGCDDGQGFLFGRPVPAEEAAALVVH